MIKQVLSLIFKKREVINIPNKDYRIALLKMERAIKNAPQGYMTTKDFKTEHTFADGLYIRKTYVPKGCIFLTFIHKKSHPAVMVGDHTLIEPTGNRRIKGVHNFITSAGTQRVCYAHEDSYCITVHLNPDNKQDIDRIEDRIYAMHYSELLDNKDRELNEELSFLNDEEVLLCQA